MSVWRWLKGLFVRAPRVAFSEPSDVMRTWTGNKYFGGYGPTVFYELDYATLRNRSRQLFRENLYARGIIRRLITNEINTGLTLEAFPYSKGIGQELTEEQLGEWSDDVEARFHLWATDPMQCDYAQRRTFAELQREARRSALVDGDVLVVLHIDPKTNAPRVQLIPAAAVMAPGIQEENHTVVHGVELDDFGRHLGYWVLDDKGKNQRIPAWGENSGRRIAWLMYGTDRLIDDVRGEPMLALILQSLKEVDRYRDSAQRKAALNAMIAYFLKKTQAKPSSKSLSGGAVRLDEASVTQPDEGTRTLALAEMIPGVFMEELQHGEEPVPHSTAGTDINFGEFEEAIIQGVAWALEIPPEILRLAFSNNYSASQAAINEFKIYLAMIWDRFAAEFCKPIYGEWLAGEVLSQRVIAAGFTDALRDTKKRTVASSWLVSEWTGSVKPSTDMVKQATAFEKLTDRGWSTNVLASRLLTGTKFATNVRRIKRERQQLIDAGLLPGEGGSANDELATDQGSASQASNSEGQLTEANDSD